MRDKRIRESENQRMGDVSEDGGMYGERVRYGGLEDMEDMEGGK